MIKFINRLRSSFQELLVKPLYIQVCLKFPELQNDLNLKSMISIQYNKDNMFDELKTMEIMQKRLDFISALKDNLVETDENMNDIPYFDLDFLVKKYLKMDPTDLDQNAKEKKQKEKESELLSFMDKINSPAIMVLNKIDLIDRKNVLPMIESYTKLFPFKAVIPLSALKGDGAANLLEVHPKDPTASTPQHS